MQFRLIKIGHIGMFVNISRIRWLVLARWFDSVVSMLR